MISKGSWRGATLDLDDLQYRHGKPGLTVAFRTQFANDLFAVELADLVRLDNRRPSPSARTAGNNSFRLGERLLGVGSRTDRTSASMPCGVSHVAVVTGDLDAYRAFYEDVIGLETTLVLGPGPGHGRQAILAAGEVMLHVFEVPGYDPAAHGHRSTMFERGRLDHLGFTVPNEAALATLRDRLVAVDASSGAIRRLGPMLSVRFQDPDEFEGEVNCLDPTYDPSTLRDEDNVVDPLWFARMAAVLHAPLDEKDTR